jgi:succinate dehydrogenase / fumarate reductase iron-sulfur subunit
LNCTEVCPKEISPTRAIKYIQKHACLDAFRRNPKDTRLTAEIPEEAARIDRIDTVQEPPRRRFLKHVTYGLSAATAAVVGGVLVSAALGPAMRKTPSQWVRAGSINDFKPDNVTTVYLRYRVKYGFYQSQNRIPIMVARSRDVNQLNIYNSRCTHLGCTVRWDEGKRLFLCACHGGAFNIDGSVNAGPPPRSLDRYAFKVEDGALFVEVV